MFTHRKARITSCAFQSLYTANNRCQATLSTDSCKKVLLHLRSDEVRIKVNFYYSDSRSCANMKQQNVMNVYELIFCIH